MRCPLWVSTLTTVCIERTSSHRHSMRAGSYQLRQFRASRHVGWVHGNQLIRGPMIAHRLMDRLEKFFNEDPFLNSLRRIRYSNEATSPKVFEHTEHMSRLAVVYSWLYHAWFGDDVFGDITTQKIIFNVAVCAKGAFQRFDWRVTKAASRVDYQCGLVANTEVE